MEVNEQMEAYGTSNSVIRELYAYGQERIRDVGADRVFDFSLGNPCVAPPKEVEEKIRELLDRMEPVTLHGYTDNRGDRQARQMFADSLNRRFHAGVDADDFYLTPGAAPALCCCVRGLMTEACDEFVILAPYFPEYRVYIEGNGGRAVIVPPDTETFQIDFTELEKALTPRTRAVFLNSPNNPSGALCSPETLRQLAALLREASDRYGHTIALISDEPYRDIVFGGRTAPWIPDYYPDTVVCFSYSKSLSIPGERIGWVCVPKCAHEQRMLIDAIYGAGRSMGFVNANALFQRVAAACCDLTSDVSIYERNRDILVRELPRYGYEFVPPEGTFYLFLKAFEADDRAFSDRAKKHDLLLVPGCGFGCPGYVRLAFCVPTERVERSLPAFRALAEEYGRAGD